VDVTIGMSDTCARMSDSVDVTEIGVDSVHERGFVWSRPQGLGQWMFLHLPVPTPILDATGRAQCRPGDCLILDPRFPHWHAAEDAPIRNDWFWARGDAIGRWAAENGLPLNHRFHPDRVEVVPRILGDIIVERLRRPRGWRRRVALLIEMLFQDLGRQRAGGSGDSRAERLRDVRAQVHARLAEPWTVARMARIADMGPDRFALAYRRLFGLPPVEDLLLARLRRACSLLAGAGGDVAGAARACGFRDVPWFSRCFRARFGCPPGAFARGEADIRERRIIGA
jgi:AraC-like DNA-binding protein